MDLMNLWVETYEFVSGVSTHMNEGRGGGTPRGSHDPRGCCPPPSSYIKEGGAPLPHTPFHRSFGWSLLPLPADPPLELWLRRSPAQVVSPPPRRWVIGVPRGSITSAAPLDRGNGGRRQAVRVTEYGGAARLQRTSSSRSWDRQVIVYTTHENRSRWQSFVSSRVCQSVTYIS
jgi:hypothetical protein